AHPRLLDALAVVRRVPRLADQRAQLEALDEDSALVVHRERGRADHALAAARRQPPRGGVEQRPRDVLAVLELQKAEPAPALTVVVVVGVVDVRADASHHATVARR